MARARRRHGNGRKTEAWGLSHKLVAAVVYMFVFIGFLYLTMHLGYIHEQNVEYIIQYLFLGTASGIFTAILVFKVMGRRRW